MERGILDAPVTLGLISVSLAVFILRFALRNPNGSLRLQCLSLGTADIKDFLRQFAWQGFCTCANTAAESYSIYHMGFWISVHTSASSAWPRKFWRPEAMFYWVMSSLKSLSLHPHSPPGHHHLPLICDFFKKTQHCRCHSTAHISVVWNTRMSLHNILLIFTSYIVGRCNHFPLITCGN